MTILLVIPARWASSRLPGKPLVMIAGKSLLERTIDLARRSTRGLSDIATVVATDDARIADHARHLGVDVEMTDPGLTTGSARALAAARQQVRPWSHICNLQGDAPFLPVCAVQGILEALATRKVECITPVVSLTWQALDRLRDHKKGSWASGTTCVRGADGRALWFSKAILPTIRHEDDWRARSPRSPVYRHLGIYGFSRAALERFVAAPPSLIEQLEGLEQLRIIELGVAIETIVVEEQQIPLGGIDSPADVAEAERLIRQYGDPFGR